MKGILLAALLLALLFYAFWPGPFALAPPQLAQANENYARAEAAADPLERESAYNEALSGYLELEGLYRPTLGNGNLYRRIGETYESLDEKALALYYYERAQALRPFDQELKNSAAALLQQLERPPRPAPSPFSSLFPLEQLPLPRQLQLLFWSSAAALSLGYLSLISRSRLPVLGSSLAAAIAIATALGLGYLTYAAPLEALVIRGTHLYHGSSKESSPLSDFLFYPGEKVQVIEVSRDGRWLKASTLNGEIGYLPYSSARLLP